MQDVENILEVVNLSECDQRKDFGLLYIAWMSDNKFNIASGNTVDSNHRVGVIPLVHCTCKLFNMLAHLLQALGLI